MLLDPRISRVFIYNVPVDMRKGHNGLAAIVRNEMGRNLLSGDVFLFGGRNRRVAKALLWDGTGTVVLHKKFERGRMMRLDLLAPGVMTSLQTLNLILGGADICLDLDLRPEPV